MRGVTLRGRFVLWRDGCFKDDWWHHEKQAKSIQRTVTYNKGVCFFESLAICFKYSFGGSWRWVLFSSESGFVYSHPVAGKSIWNKEMIFPYIEGASKYIINSIVSTLDLWKLENNFYFFLCYMVLYSNLKKEFVI